jgi:hypothetical protein
MQKNGRLNCRSPHVSKGVALNPRLKILSPTATNIKAWGEAEGGTPGNVHEGSVPEGDEHYGDCLSLSGTEIDR